MNACIFKEDSNIMDLIQKLHQDTLAKEPPQVSIGDTVRVHVKVREGARERIQIFEGTVIAKKHGGIQSPSAAFPTAWAWKKSFRSIPPRLTVFRLCAGAWYAVPNSTICVNG